MKVIKYAVFAFLAFVLLREAAVLILVGSPAPIPRWYFIVLVGVITGLTFIVFDLVEKLLKEKAHHA